MNAPSDTYERILTSAKQLMHASSYADVGVAAICEHAQVKKGSFYHFFPSKQDLTLAVLDTYFADMKEAIIDQAFTPNLPPMQQLTRFIELAIELQTDIHQQTGQVLGCPFGNLASELSTQDEIIRKKIDKLFGRVQSLIQETLQAAVELDEIEPLDTEVTALAILAYFEGTMLMAKTQNNPKILRQLLPAATKIRIPLSH